MNIFSYPFIQHALFAALLSGLVTPAIGIRIVQRHLSLLSDGLEYIVIMGVGLILLTGAAPLSIAVVTCVAGFTAVELPRQSGKISGDLGLAVLLYGGITPGAMMAGIAGQGPASLPTYLFGALTPVNESDLRVIVVPTVAALAFSLGLLPRSFTVCADEDFARVLGIRMELSNLFMVVIAFMIVILSMCTVGLLLISAFMVIPVIVSRQLFTGPRAILLGMMGIGVLVALGGTSGSYHWNAAAGTTIVMMAIVLLGIATLVGIFLALSPRLIPFVLPHGKKKRILAEKLTGTGPPFG